MTILLTLSKFFRFIINCECEKSLHLLQVKVIKQESIRGSDSYEDFEQNSLLVAMQVRQRNCDSSIK